VGAADGWGEDVQVKSERTSGDKPKRTRNRKPSSCAYIQALGRQGEAVLRAGGADGVSPLSPSFSLRLASRVSSNQKRNPRAVTEADFRDQAFNAGRRNYAAIEQVPAINVPGWERSVAGTSELGFILATLKLRGFYPALCLCSMRGQLTTPKPSGTKSRDLKPSFNRSPLKASTTHPAKASAPAPLEASALPRHPPLFNFPPPIDHSSR
jgi:hypothetical protein